MTVGDGHGVDLTPGRGEERLADLVQLDARATEKAKAGEEVPLRLGAGGHGHVHGADVAGIDEDLRDRQPALLRLEVADDEARHPDRIAGVIPVAYGQEPAVENHGGGEDLEDRAHLVGAQRGAVEARVARGAGGAVGIEAGQGDQGQNLAVVSVEDQAGGADRLELAHGGAQLLEQDMLHTNVEAQMKRIGGASQRLVEGKLDTR